MSRSYEGKIAKFYIFLSIFIASRTYMIYADDGKVKLL